MTNGTLTPLSAPRAGAEDSLAPDGTRRWGPGSYLVLNVGGWLFFGAAVMIGWLEQYPWQVALLITPAYILFGFLLSLLLGFAYDRLGVGPASFGRAIAISFVGSYAAAVPWTAAFYYYRQYGVSIIHSVIIGEPSPIAFPPDWVLDGTLDNTLPLFGWSLVRLALQYNTALREQREQALRAETAARDAQLQM